MALALVDNTPSPEVPADFSTFWLLWGGKRIEKKLCKLQWGYLLGPQQMSAIVAAAAWRSYWEREDYRYLPDPLKWIQGERWEDELPRGAINGSAAHVPFEPSAPGVRCEMPEHVKAMIAKLRTQK